MAGLARTPVDYVTRVVPCPGRGSFDPCVPGRPHSVVKASNQADERAFEGLETCIKTL